MCWFICLLVNKNRFTIDFFGNLEDFTPFFHIYPWLIRNRAICALCWRAYGYILTDLIVFRVPFLLPSYGTLSFLKLDYWSTRSCNAENWVLLSFSWHNFLIIIDSFLRSVQCFVSLLLFQQKVISSSEIIVGLFVKIFSHSFNI